ncbi:MAG: SDR family oxidoreductase [Sphingomonadaceae bacterium]|nr:SDR family oxidoreductase [Sphingomonadaceae bacterium]
MAFALDQFALEGKVAIVTGAGARGNSIGRAYAFGLANAGASILVADLDGDGAERVAIELREAGYRARSTRVDISDPASAKAMAAAADAAFGGVDILVNNAAMMAELEYHPASTVPIDYWNKVLAVNLTGALNCAQAVLPLMRARSYGRIVNAVSGGAFPAQSVYGITKLALVGLTTTLATELGRENITVNAIAPGNTMSEAGAGLTPPESPFKKKMEQMVVMRIEGQPDELVGALILLASPAGGWMTGQVLHVDGGWILRP